MSAAAYLDVDQFVFLPATADAGLLRLSGYWEADPEVRLDPPVMVIDPGPGAQRLRPLPGAEDAALYAGPAGIPWRAAFAAPADLVESATAFALELSDGAVVELPAPSKHVLAAPATRPVEPVPEREMVDIDVVRTLRRELDEALEARTRADAAVQEAQTELAGVQRRLEVALE